MERVMRNLSIVVFLTVLFICNAAGANTLTVKTVHSGDIVEFEGGFTARFTGIRAPEKSTKLGYEVYDYTKRRLEGKIVKVFTYTTNNMASGIVYDEDGYPFVQIVYGESRDSRDWSTNFNELLLKKGYARVDEKYLPAELEYFKKIEELARGEKIGIWETE
ncbi:MAG: hypothetical protein GF307_06570 [candidate division Zixibacteria bacterium]|nr:hypothetical protein [candidate division Zixibacteria bacterium]